MLTEQDMIRILERGIEKEGDAKKFAKKAGVSASFISDVRTGRRAVSDKIAGVLGYIKITGFKKK